MSKPQDPIDDLQQAWQSLPIPPATRELEEEDALTQQTVHFLQEAWKQLEVPVAQVPALKAGKGRLLTFSRFLASAAAATLIGLGLFEVARQTDQPTVPTEQLQADLTPNELETSNAEKSSGEIPTRSSDSAPELLAEVISSDSERIEMRAGSVRLVLLQPESNTHQQD